MFIYRITKYQEEIKQYLEKNVYFGNNEGLFSYQSKGIYKINTFKYTDNTIYKHFYYFPIDAFEISKILLENSTLSSDKFSQLYILEYYINNDEVLDKIGFGNYNCLRRKDYINNYFKKIPFENGTYPVLEIRLEASDNVQVTNKSFVIDKYTPLPNDLNNLKKLRQFIYYKMHIEEILEALDVKYPHGKDGLMRISEGYHNIKTIKIPNKYRKILY